MVLLIFVLICWKVYVSYHRGEKGDAIVFGVIGTILCGLFLLLSLV